MSDYYIGYSEKSALYITIPSFSSIIMNFIFILYYSFKKCLSKYKYKSKLSSLEKILLTLTILECLISLCWFLSGVLFETEKEIYEKKNKCEVLGAFQTFFYIFDWILSNKAVSHLKNMLFNPINYILKSNKKLRFYLLKSGLAALVLSLLCYFMDILGKSPMLTCFLSLDIYYDDENSKSKQIIGLIIISLICFIPVYNVFYGFTQIIITCISQSFQEDLENKRIFNDNSINFIIYFVMTFFLTSLYILDFIKDGDIGDSKLFKNYFFGVSILISLSPLIMGIFRLYQTHLLKTCYKAIKKKYFAKRTRSERDSLLSNLSSFEEFESEAIEKFVMNIYIAVCFCLEKKINVKDLNFDELTEKMNTDTTRYEISKFKIMNELKNGKLINDKLVSLREEFSISCVEYAPKIFKYLRHLDGIGEDIIVNSMLPMNNKIGINETEGRGGSFFVISDDNEFILKTITFEEMELLRNLLLNKIVKYFHENNDSIISRIYGVYKISIHSGLFKEDEIYFILMKNVIGSFADNLICKYDLKGSSLDRKVKYENVDKKVMKDLNFNEAEQIFLLSKHNADKLIDIATRDANFFCSSRIMDYSLLVAKISLNNEEVKFLFGKDHRKKSEKEFFRMAGIERQTLSGNELDNNKDNKIKVDDNKIDGDNSFSNIRFSDSKIESLKKYFFPSLKGDVLYILSIIDFFQVYNIQKNLETKYKKWTKRVSVRNISSVPPEDYRDRFINFIKKITDSESYIKEIYDTENQNDF